MFRGFVGGCLGLIVYLVFFVAAIVAGIAAKSWLVFFGVLAFSFVVVYFLLKIINQIGRVNMDNWLESMSQCQYKYAYDGSGIAVDSNARRIYLTARWKGNAECKEYDFASVRDWGYEIPGFTWQSPDRVIGGGVQGAGHNIGSSVGAGIANSMSVAAAAEKSGLTVSVADIDFPKWFIKFKPQKELKMELARWMEILNQTVNG